MTDTTKGATPGSEPEVLHEFGNYRVIDLGPLADLQYCREWLIRNWISEPGSIEIGTELARLAASERALREENMCDACAGTGTPVSGAPCMCGGTGKMSDAARYLREQLVAERTAKEEALRERDEDRKLIGELASALDRCHEDALHGETDYLDSKNWRALTARARARAQGGANGE